MPISPVVASLRAPLMLRCVRCGIALRLMRGVIERRRDGDADGVREKSRRAGDADEDQIVTRIVTVRSYHDRTPCVLCDSKPSLTPDHPSQRPRVTKPGACDACRTRDPDTYQTRVE